MADSLAPILTGTPERDPPSVEGSPDGAEEVRLPELREDYPAAGAVSSDRTRDQQLDQFGPYGTRLPAEFVLERQLP